MYSNSPKEFSVSEMTRNKFGLIQLPFPIVRQELLLNDKQNLDSDQAVHSVQSDHSVQVPSHELSADKKERFYSFLRFKH